MQNSHVSVFPGLKYKHNLWSQGGLSVLRSDCQWLLSKIFFLSTILLLPGVLSSCKLSLMLSSHIAPQFHKQFKLEYCGLVIRDSSSSFHASCYFQLPNDSLTLCLSVSGKYLQPLGDHAGSHTSDVIWVIRKLSKIPPYRLCLSHHESQDGFGYLSDSWCMNWGGEKQETGSMRKDMIAHFVLQQSWFVSWKFLWNYCGKTLNHWEITQQQILNRSCVWLSVEWEEVIVLPSVVQWV